MRIGDVEVRIDPERDRHERAAIGQIGVEEIAIVEIAIGARERDWLGGLVNRIVIALGQHRNRLSCVSRSLGAAPGCLASGKTAGPQLSA